MSELQSDIVVNGNEISGTLNYVEGYTGFSSDPEYQSGHYLAMKFETTIENATITVAVMNGETGREVQLDDDGMIVDYLTDTEAQSLRVKTYVDGEVVETVDYSLQGLVLATE